MPTRRVIDFFGSARLSSVRNRQRHRMSLLVLRVDDICETIRFNLDFTRSIGAFSEFGKVRLATWDEWLKASPPSDLNLEGQYLRRWPASVRPLPPLPAAVAGSSAGGGAAATRPSQGGAWGVRRNYFWRK